MKNEALEELVIDFWTAFEPTPDIAVDQWAEENRWLTRETTDEAGLFRVSRAEYQRGPMRAITDPETEEIVLAWASQTGKTEVGLCILGRFIDVDPCPMLVTVPVGEDVKTYSRERLAVMVAASPVLTEKVAQVKSRTGDNTIGSKSFPGGRISIVASQSPTGLCARPIRLHVGDEVDRYSDSAGTEGDPLSLVSRRQSTFWNRKRALISSPTVEGRSRIWAAYKDTTQEKYFVPCPRCGKLQVLDFFAGVKFDIDRTNPKQHKILPKTARYVCPYCRGAWSEQERHDAVRKGKWLAKYPGRRQRRGFHLSALYSPWMTLVEIVDEFRKAGRDPLKLQVFFNTTLALLWSEARDQLDAEGLVARREDYPPNPVPEGVALITAGVDVQGDRLECEVLGWGADEQTWSLEYHVVHGSPEVPDTWARLDMVLQKRYAHPSGAGLRIQAVCVDSGYATDAVHAFTTPRFRRNIIPTKGHAKAGMPILTHPRGGQKAKQLGTKARHRVWMIGTGAAKNQIDHRLRVKSPDNFGYQHFPERYTAEYFDGLTAEHAETRLQDGKRVRKWILPAGVRNEQLDCRVYAVAAREFLGYDTEQLNSLAETIRTGEVRKPQKPTSRRRRRMKRREE